MTNEEIILGMIHENEYVYVKTSKPELELIYTYLDTEVYKRKDIPNSYYIINKYQKVIHLNSIELDLKNNIIYAYHNMYLSYVVNLDTFNNSLCSYYMNYIRYSHDIRKPIGYYRKVQSLTPELDLFRDTGNSNNINVFNTLTKSFISSTNYKYQLKYIYFVNDDNCIVNIQTGFNYGDYDCLYNGFIELPNNIVVFRGDKMVSIRQRINDSIKQLNFSNVNYIIYPKKHEKYLVISQIISNRRVDSVINLDLSNIENSTRLLNDEKYYVQCYYDDIYFYKRIKDLNNKQEFLCIQ